MSNTQTFACTITFKEERYLYGQSISSKSMSLYGLAEFVNACAEANFEIQEINLKVIEESEGTTETTEADSPWRENHELEA